MSIRRILPAVLSCSIVLCGCSNLLGTSKNAEPNDAMTMTASDSAELILFWEFEHVGTVDEPMTKATLILSGPSTESLEVGTFPGTGVDTRTISADYSRGGSVLGAIFWQGDQSEEIAIDVTNSHTLMIKRRTTNKDGSTTDWQPTNVIPLPGEVAVRAGAYVDPYRQP